MEDNSRNTCKEGTLSIGCRIIDEDTFLFFQGKTLTEEIINLRLTGWRTLAFESR